MRPPSLVMPQPDQKKAVAVPTAPPTPYPWLWRCHACHTVYRLGCTRRCLECSHEFCSLPQNSPSSRKRRRSKRNASGPCKAEFDYAGWAAWGAFRRSQLALAVSTPSEGLVGSRRYRRLVKPRQMKKGTGGGRSWTDASLATYEAVVDRGDGVSTTWRPKTDAAELEAITRAKEALYVRGQHSCWLVCDFPSECRHSVYTACIQGRARSTGKGRAVLVGDGEKAKAKALSTLFEEDEDDADADADAEAAPCQTENADENGGLLAGVGRKRDWQPAHGAPPFMRPEHDHDHGESNIRLGQVSSGSAHSSLNRAVELFASTLGNQAELLGSAATATEPELDLKPDSFYGAGCSHHDWQNRGNDLDAELGLDLHRSTEMQRQRARLRSQVKIAQLTGLDSFLPVGTAPAAATTQPGDVGLLTVTQHREQTDQRECPNTMGMVHRATGSSQGPNRLTNAALCYTALGESLNDDMSHSSSRRTSRDMEGRTMPSTESWKDWEDTGSHSSTDIISNGFDSGSGSSCDSHRSSGQVGHMDMDVDMADIVLADAVVLSSASPDLDPSETEELADLLQMRSAFLGGQWD